VRLRFTLESHLQPIVLSVLEMGFLKLFVGTGLELQFCQSQLPK
jgi:hypothetical protein